MGTVNAAEAVDALRARSEQLEIELGALRDEVQRLHDRTHDLEPSPPAVSDRPLTRRRLFGMAGAAAAAGAAGAVLAASPAGAADPNDVVIDGANVGTATTRLTSSANGGAALSVANSGANSALEANAGGGAGVIGSSATGNSVVASAPTANSAGAHMSLVPGSTAGPPTAGAHTMGQFWMDSAGILFQCTVAGTPGTWVQMPQLGRDQDIATTATTRLEYTGSASGWWVANLGGGIAVTGQSTSGVGVEGTTDGGVALQANVNLAASGVQLELLPTNQVGPPITGTHGLGQFVLDQNGVLHQCVVAGADTDAKWVRQSPLVTLDAPVRIYYSVTAGDPLLGNTQERSVTVTNGTTIPHNASAVLTNLAVTPSAGDGFLAMFKDGTVWPGTSNLNYSAGAFASNNATSAVAFSAGTGKVTIHCGGGAVHFVIDVFGYYP